MMMTEKTNLWRLALNTVMKPVAGIKSIDIRMVGEALKSSAKVKAWVWESNEVRHAVGEMVLKVANLIAFVELVFGDDLEDEDDEHQDAD